MASLERGIETKKYEIKNYISKINKLKIKVPEGSTHLSFILEFVPKRKCICFYKEIDKKNKEYERLSKNFISSTKYAKLEEIF